MSSIVVGKRILHCREPRVNPCLGRVLGEGSITSNILLEKSHGQWGPGEAAVHEGIKIKPN